MQTPSNPRIKIAAAAIIGFLLALIVLMLGIHTDFSLSDEGFLWYGAQRVLAGEVPLRDFESYDPFRYYWAAGVMGLLRDHGIVALRIAATLFGALGVALANWLVFRRAQRRMLLLNLLIAAVFVLWLLPRHKIFDITACIGLVAALTLFLEKPSRRRSFLLGIVVGFVAIIGRNHGLYGGIAAVLVLAYVVWAERKGDAAGLFGCWCAGLVVGYLPMLLALTLVPGLFPAFLDGIRKYFQWGATNVALPLPLPWRVPFLHQSGVASLRQLLLGLSCIGLPLFGLLGLGLAAARARARRALPPLMVACAALAIPYTQFFYSRADLAHLAQSVFPLLIALCALAVMESGKKPAVFAAALLAVSTFMMLPLQPLYAAWNSGHWQSRKVGTDTLSMPPAEAAQVSALQTLVARYAPDDRPFLAAPYVPGAYALFERRSPVWESYPLLRADDAHQSQEIRDLAAAHIGFALVDTTPLDRNPAQRFSENDPLVYKYLTTQLQKVDDPSLPEGWEVYAASPAAEVDKTPAKK